MQAWHDNIPYKYDILRVILGLRILVRCVYCPGIAGARPINCKTGIGTQDADIPDISINIIGIRIG